MSDTKILQAILDGQADIRNDVALVRSEMKEGFEKVNRRVDMLGEQLAVLDDDAPTREEFEKLEKQMGRIEDKLALG